MNTFLVSYDLIRPGKDYSTLHHHLKSYSNWAKPLESLWLIKSSLTAEQLRNTVQQYLDANDKILIIDVTDRAAAWKNLGVNVSTWIKNNL
ncbi:MAG: CRISPR-associated protein Cas2 [Patescibacteria group bacterium]